MGYIGKSITFISPAGTHGAGKVIDEVSNDVLEVGITVPRYMQGDTIDVNKRNIVRVLDEDAETDRFQKPIDRMRNLLRTDKTTDMVQLRKKKSAKSKSKRKPKRK